MLTHPRLPRLLIASITSASSAEMALRPGLRVMVAFKATAIHLV